MKNLNGEYISDEKVEEIDKRIANLSREHIDELFHRLNFRISKSEKGEEDDRERKYLRIENKALSPHMIDQIKEGNSGNVRNLIEESPLDALRSNLNELERREDKKSQESP